LIETDGDPAIRRPDRDATVLHLLDMNPERLMFKFQGLAQKLTRVAPAKIVPDLIA
jgi:hypothetical protein